MLGVHSLTWEEAQLLSGVDPDFHRRDLADAIEAGAYPQWDLGIQVFPDTEDQTFEGIDLLDPTKIVPEELAPVQPIGRLTLTANPTNYFAETEQVAFHVGHLVPGIDVTDDPLLQAGCSPTSTPRSPGSAARTSPRSRSTARTRRSTTCCATGSTSTPCTRAWRRTGRTRWTAAARSSPAPTTAAFVERAGAVAGGEQGARVTRRRSPTTSARSGCSG